MSSASDFVIYKGRLEKYTGPGGDVVVPAGVTRIGDKAFRACEEVTSVILPEGVTEIGEWAFMACGKLQSIQIPEGVTAIGEGAFWYCESMPKIVFPATMTQIGKHALGNCKSLTSITILGEKLAGMSSAFFGKVSVHFHVRNINVIPAAMRIDAACKFVDHMQDYDARERVVYCKYIKSKADKFADHAARNVSMMQLLCGEKMITAKDAPAYLEAVQKAGNAEIVAMMLEYNANVLTAKDKQRAEQKKEAAEEAVLERKIMRQEKKGIAGSTLVVAGGSFETFKTGEIKIYIEEKGGILAKTMSAKVDYLVVKDLQTSGDKREKAEALGVEVITERQLNEMTDRVFEIDAKNTLVRYFGVGGDLVIPENVTKIGKKAFENCKVLTSVTFPKKLKEIGISAFKGCSNLTSVTFPEKLSKIGGYAFLHCTQLTSVTIPGKIKSMGQEAFSGCTSLRTVTIAEGVTSLDKFVFCHCPNLVTVNLPDSLTSIDEFAFGRCTALTTITIPASVMYIDATAFFELENLTICGVPGSCAETFAKKQEYTFFEK